MMQQPTINNLKGCMINNDVHAFGSKCHYEYKDVWSEESGKFCFCFRGQKDCLRTLIKSLLMHLQNFYPEIKSFAKNGNKFDWVKYWQMTFYSPNSP